MLREFPDPSSVANSIVGSRPRWTMKAVVSGGAMASVLDAYCTSATSLPRVVAHRTSSGCLDHRRERATIACPFVEGLPKTSPSRRW